jgi:hypothetical protein
MTERPRDGLQCFLHLWRPLQIDHSKTHDDNTILLAAPIPLREKNVLSHSIYTPPIPILLQLHLISARNPIYLLHGLLNSVYRINKSPTLPNHEEESHKTPVRAVQQPM